MVGLDGAAGSAGLFGIVADLSGRTDSTMPQNGISLRLGTFWIIFLYLLSSASIIPLLPE